MALILGIDAGSVAVKVMALSDSRPVSWFEEPTRPDIASQCRDLIQRAGEVEGICATGYGRNLVRQTESRVNEIMANALGAGWMQRHWSTLEDLFGDAPVPERLAGRFRTIVDVGGQDSKVITLDREGLIRDFAMNDRCAAGTGRFLEVMAGALETDIAGLSRLALAAREAAHISRACTVFAESEVVSLLAEGVPPQQVAAGVFESVAEQVTGLAERCMWEPPVLFDGGPSRSGALRQALARHFDSEMLVPPCGQFATALGAALIAADPRLSRQLTRGDHLVS